MSYRIETLCQHNNIDNTGKETALGALSYPIYQTATFAHPGLGKSTGFDYTRASNPTRSQLEATVAQLEKGTDALAFTSGMSALYILMELFKPGDHIIVGDDLYGGSTRLFSSISGKNGIEFTPVDTSKESIEPYIRENTKAVYVETPTNPLMNVTDIGALAEITKKHGLLLVVDNTFLSPYLQNPLELGADVVLHSGTKYLGGHNDTLAGFLVVKDKELADKLRFVAKTTGANLAPFDSFLIARGIKTLAVRMDRAEENARKLAEVIRNNPHVKKVFYPGFEDHPGYAIMKKQARGFGAMLTFEVDSKELARDILERVKIISFAESLGGTESLITYPITQTHSDVPAETLNKLGINDRVLRLSVGIENIEDLIEDITNAING